MGYSIVCNFCRAKTRYDAKKPMPSKCPECSSSWGQERADSDVVVPFLHLSGVTKAHDSVFRQVEAASERRAEMAAEAAGCSVSEMSGLKITDLRSSRHQGEVAAVPVNNSVTQRMDEMRARGLPTGFGVPNGAEYGANVQAGAFPNAGARMRNVLHEHHAQISHGSATSDLPALETTAPGYRRRA